MDKQKESAANLSKLVNHEEKEVVYRKLIQQRLLDGSDYRMKSLFQDDKDDLRR